MLVHTIPRAHEVECSKRLRQRYGFVYDALLLVSGFKLVQERTASVNGDARAFARSDPILLLPLLFLPIPSGSRPSRGSDS